MSSAPSATTVFTAASPSAGAVEARPFKFSWQQTMLRIKDPKKSVPFYCDNFGFRQIMHYDFPEWNFSLYFLAILRDGEFDGVEPDSEEAENFLWNFPGVVLELTHNHGSENDPDFKVNNGNVEPHRGFGHLALMTPDVYKSCDKLMEKNVKFQKKPNDGMMKGLAFVLDPDGYWIEIIKRNAGSKFSSYEYTLAQTMLRVKDPAKSLAFYRDLLGMSLLSENHIGVGQSWAFSLYFLADGKVPADSSMGDIFEPVLELTHNHGTEVRPEFKYHNGNDQDAGQVKGFGHIGFLVDDLDKCCEWMEANGVAFKKKPTDGTMRTLAFALDPDNYWVEIIQRGGVKMLKKK